MYMVETFISEGFLGFKWPSDLHYRAAKNALLNNPCITTKDQLVESAKIIAAISEDDLKNMTYGDFADMGIPLRIKCSSRQYNPGAMGSD